MGLSGGLGTPRSGDPAGPTLPPRYFEDSEWTGIQEFFALKEIGKGKDTVIYSASCVRFGNQKVALKVYNKERLAATKIRAIKREIAMMIYFQKHRVPYVVQFYGAFEDERYYYIIMEYCERGDLLERLLREKRAISERRIAVDVAVPMLCALQSLHSLSIIHRDVKLENIFIDAEGGVKLGDFGLTMSQRQESAISPVGTVEYMAPEVVALPPVDAVLTGAVAASDISPTGESVDIWALGVTLYELATGRLPFEGRDKAEIKASITAYRLAAFGRHVSPVCQDFIKSMLAYSPLDRPAASALLCHPFLRLHAPQSKAALQALSLLAYPAGCIPGDRTLPAPGIAPLALDGDLLPAQHSLQVGDLLPGQQSLQVRAPAAATEPLLDGMHPERHAPLLEPLAMPALEPRPTPLRPAPGSLAAMCPTATPGAPIAPPAMPLQASLAAAIQLARPGSRATAERPTCSQPSESSSSGEALTPKRVLGLRHWARSSSLSPTKVAEGRPQRRAATWAGAKLAAQPGLEKKGVVQEVKSAVKRIFRMRSSTAAADGHSLLGPA